MGAIVVNNKLKMEWQKSGWLEIKNKTTKKNTFVFASHEYISEEDGREITVFFVPETVFILYDAGDDVLFDAKDVADMWKENGGIGNFPFSLNEYVPVVDSDNGKCIESVLEQFGLTDQREDIEARFEDIIPYGIESEVSFDV